MRLIATRSFRYRGRQLKAGDAFDASNLDGKAYKAIRYAGDAPEPPPKPAPKHTPEPPEPVEDRPATRYPTRRLKADD